MLELLQVATQGWRDRWEVIAAVRQASARLNDREEIKLRNLVVVQTYY